MSDLQNDLARALLTARFAGDIVDRVSVRTVHEALVPALLPIVDRYVAAELVRLADRLQIPSPDRALTDSEAWYLHAVSETVGFIRSRAVELTGGDELAGGAR